MPKKHLLAAAEGLPNDNAMQSARMPVWGASARLVPIRPPAPRAPVQFVDPTKFPRLFKMNVEGDCLHPLIADGTMLVFDKSATMGPMTIIGVCLAPDVLGPFWQHQWIVKRLVEPFPPGARLGSPVAAARRKPAAKMIVEQINPFQHHTFTADQVLAIVGCVGTTEFGPNDWRAPASDYAWEGRRHD